MNSTVTLREYLRLLRAYHKVAAHVGELDDHVGELDDCENGECLHGKRVAGRAAMPGAIRRMTTARRPEASGANEAAGSGGASGGNEGA